MKKYAAEFVGAFALTLAVMIAIASGTIFVPLVAMLTLGLFVYSIGHLSGCHINPAVTAGAWTLKKISTHDAVAYIVAQFLGAIAAMMIATSVLGVTDLGLVAEGSVAIALAEALGMFFFAFGIAAVIFGKIDDDMSGIVIGGSLALGIIIASSVSNGVLNPAVAVGIGSLSLAYLLGPVVGSILGMQAYKMIATKE